MNKVKTVRVLLIAVSLLVIVGLALIGYYNFVLAEEDIIYIDLSKEGSRTLSFEKLGIIPGESAEYTVTFKSELDGKYRISLDFKDNNEDLTLKELMYVKLELDGTEICDSLLADVLADGAIETELELEADSEAELKITYYLPSSVENEAENAEADFKLHINYTNN